VVTQLVISSSLDLLWDQNIFTSLFDDWFLTLDTAFYIDAVSSVNWRKDFCTDFLDDRKFAWFLGSVTQSILEELNSALAFNAVALNYVLEDVFIFLDDSLAVLLSVSKLLVPVSLNPLQQSLHKPGHFYS